MTTDPAIPDDPPMSRRRLRWVAISLPILLIAAATLFPWLLYAVAKSRLEHVAGKLDAERFSFPRLPAGNAGAEMREAARQIRLSPAEKDLLTSAAKGGPATVRPQRQSLAPVLEANREAIQRALSLPQGVARLSIDYTAVDWLPHDLYLQLPLIRLVYARGELAIEDGDAAGALAAVRSLGRQAEILENEPGLIIQLYGFVAERYQLQLATALVETGAADPSPFLLSNDLCRQYRDAITLQAVGTRRALWTTSENVGKQAHGKGPLVALASVWLRETAPLVGAGAFNRYRLYFEACDREHTWIKKHLDDRPETLSERVGKTAGPDYPNVVSRYRAAAGSRALIRACQQARDTLKTGGTCGAIGKTLRGSRLEASEEPRGCVLRVVDGKDYLRLFVQPGAGSFPQECVLPVGG